MKFKLSITKKNLIFTAGFAVISLLAHIIVGISAFNMVMFIFLCLLVKVLEIELSEKCNWLWTTIAIVGGSIITTYLIQYLLLVEDLRGKISEEKFFLNICCCLVIYLVVQACTNRVDLTCMIAHIGLMIFAGIGHFVYQFRGNELTFGDLKSISTGLSVASNYEFSLNPQMMNGILVSVLLVIWVTKLKIKCKMHWMMRAICLSLAVLSSMYVANETENIVTETWEQKGSYRNGYLLNFALSIRDSFVEKPKLYSMDVVEYLEEKYGKEEVKKEEKKPTIIAIMSESFADFRVLGDLETNQQVMPFIDSLKENTVKGYAVSSVYGAKTPNSEWEFLTGNSMAYLPEGAVVYQQYLEEENAYSLVDTLKNEEYTCVAMHPYYATGWSRNTVYPKFGFDEMYFLEEFDQSNLMRKYVPDATLYDKIIQRYEEGKDTENLFLLGISMQNHGGYEAVYDNFSIDVYGTNMHYPDVDQYLSLVHQTDKATKELIDYFSKVEEPVVICFFGDHQPSLNTSFYRKLNGKGVSGLTLDELEKFYQVPFFIWTNYESESKVVEHTSLNFLSTMLLEQAGITLPAYNRFLAEFMETIPAMNARGYYSKEAKRYVYYGEGGMEEEVWLEKYRILQYNDLFDNKERSQIFFNSK